MPRLTPLNTQKPIAVQPLDRPPFWWLRWVPAAVLTVAVVYLFYILGRVAIIPLLTSVAIAYILSPMVLSIQGFGFTRTMAAVLAISFVTLMGAGFVWFVIPDLWQQFVQAGDIILANMNEENAIEVRKTIQEFSPLLNRIIGYRVYAFLRSPNKLIEASESWFAGGMTNAIATAAGALDLLVIPFFVFYILADFEAWRGTLDELIPQRFREPLSRLLDEVGRILQSYVLGQLLIAMIMGVIYAIGFALLGVPAWPGIAALSGFLNLIPYVGTLVGLVLSTGFTFASGAGLWRVGGVAAVFIVVQIFESYVLTPRILGGRLRLHPMAVFLGLLIGGRIFGFLGVLLAVPVIAVAQVFLKFVRELYKSSDFYQGKQPEVTAQPVEDVIAQAADTVLAEQVDKQTGDEVLAPSVAEDDIKARQRVP